MLICEGILLLAGLVIFIIGKVRLSSAKVVAGFHARLIGFVLMLPIIIGTILGTFVGVIDPSFIQHWENLPSLFAIELLLVVGSLLIAIIIGLRAPRYVPPETNQFYQNIPPILTSAEAALYLKVSETEVRPLIGTNQLRAKLIGTEYRIARENLDALFRD